MSSAIRLDGSEGASQLVRTALSLSLATGKSFEVQGLAKGRGETGLTTALLCCVRAAQAVSGAVVEGAEPGSDGLAFAPGPLRPGNYLLDAGSAGCVCHLVQVLAVPLGLAGAASTLKLTGLTHGAGAPTVPYLSLVWLPLLRELGHEVGLELDAAGFAPEAGGEASLTVGVARPASPLDRRSRGTLSEVRVLSTASNLPFEAACRQSERAVQRLKEAGVWAEAENLPLRAPRSRGLCCMVLGTFERGRAGFFALGGAEADAPRLADEAVLSFVAFLRGRAAMDDVLAEQLLVPLSLAAAGLQGGARVVSRLTVAPVGEPLLLTARVIERFLEVEVALLPAGDGAQADVRVALREDGLVAALRGRKAGEAD